MKMPTRQPREAAPPGIVGTARVDRRTRTLISRLEPGDIAVLDHLDMDRATAQRLVDAEVAAVVNASPFISGRYPNQGPKVLVDAGIALIDSVGPDTLGAVKDGRSLRVHEGSLFTGDESVATGRVLDADRLASELDQARSGMSSQLESFTHNSSEFLRREQELLLHGKGAPRLGTRMSGRPVVVVVPGPDHEAELKGLNRYLREQRPVLVGVDAGADALLAVGLKPDVVVMSAPSSADAEGTHISPKALRGAEDVVVLVDRGAGRTPMESLERLGVRPLRFETGATAEDAGLMLAALSDASLIVAVGAHASLDDFLDRQRGGLASTFLTRLRVGATLVDARAVPALYAGRVRTWHLWLVLLIGLVAVAAALAVTPVGQQWIDDLHPHLTDLYDRVKGLFP
ncbi:putative cytokinetic ring protein SteA [Nocardioides jensenii]|uniref:putative cytokinetic ring protein SteA n=1 Tax=Nocardioides jensenii TaxID=1843 RepID=UPI000834546C|nr:putative cytokinetic ring protein SteA [Nocardioides jensenii]